MCTKHNSKWEWGELELIKLLAQLIAVIAQLIAVIAFTYDISQQCQ